MVGGGCLAQCLALAGFHEVGDGALVAVGFAGEVFQGGVGGVFGEVEAAEVGVAGELVFDVGGGLGVQALVAGPGLAGGLAEDGLDEEQDLGVGGLAAVGDHPGGDVVPVFFHRLDALDRGDDGVGVPGGELAAGRRAAGLADDG